MGTVVHFARITNYYINEVVHFALVHFARHAIVAYTWIHGLESLIQLAILHDVCK